MTGVLLTPDQCAELAQHWRGDEHREDAEGVEGPLARRRGPQSARKADAVAFEQETKRAMRLGIMAARFADEPAPTQED